MAIEVINPNDVKEIFPQPTRDEGWTGGSPFVTEKEFEEHIEECCEGGGGGSGDGSTGANRSLSNLTATGEAHFAKIDDVTPAENKTYSSEKIEELVGQSGGNGGGGTPPPEGANKDLSNLSATGESHFSKFSGNYQDLQGKPTLGSASSQDSTAFATAQQGTKAESAVQPKVPAAAGNLATLDVSGKLGDSGKKISDFATAQQGIKAESAVQPEDIGSAAEKDETDFATAQQGALAESAVQPSDLGTAASKAATDFLQLQALVTQIINSDIAMALGKKIFATDDDGTQHILAALVRYGANQLQSELGDPRDPMCLNSSTVPGWSTDPHIKHTHKDLDGVTRDDRLAWVSELTALINNAASSLTSTYSSALIEQKLAAIISGDELGFLAFGRTLTATALPAVTVANNGQKLWDFQTNTLYNVVDGAWVCGVVKTPQANAGIDIIKMLDGVDEGGHDMTGHKVSGIWSGTAWTFGIDNNTEYTFGSTFKTNADGSKDVEDVTLAASDIVDDNTKYTATVSPLGIFTFLKSIPRKINALFTKASLQEGEISDLQDIIKGDLGNVDITTTLTAFASTEAGIYKINWTNIQAATNFWPTFAKNKLPDTCGTILIVTSDNRIIAGNTAPTERKQLATFIGGYVYTMNVRPDLAGNNEANKWERNGTSIVDQNGRIWINKGQQRNTPNGAIKLHVNGKIKSTGGFDFGVYPVNDPTGTAGNANSNPNAPRIWSDGEGSVNIKARQVNLLAVGETQLKNNYQFTVEGGKVQLGTRENPLEYLKMKISNGLRIEAGSVAIGRRGKQSGEPDIRTVIRTYYRDDSDSISYGIELKANEQRVFVIPRPRMPHQVARADRNKKRPQVHFLEKPLLHTTMQDNRPMEFMTMWKTSILSQPHPNSPPTSVTPITDPQTIMNMFGGSVAGITDLGSIAKLLTYIVQQRSIALIDARPSMNQGAINPATLYTGLPIRIRQLPDGTNSTFEFSCEGKPAALLFVNGARTSAQVVIYDWVKPNTASGLGINLVRRGNTVSAFIKGTTTTAISSAGVLLGTIPIGFRPSSILYTDASNQTNLLISSNGKLITVNVVPTGLTGLSAEIPLGTPIYGNTTWLVD